MTENVQKSFASEFIEILRLITIFALRRINLQHVLYSTAFLTFGLADGITAAYMMEKLGTGIEANPIARYLFMSQGFGGMVIAKAWFAIVILFAAFIVEVRSPTNMYWTINGFLVALTVGGAMAANANLTVLAGGVPQAPGEIIFTFLGLLIMLTEIGGFVDRKTATYTGYEV
jgi:hypothetical protein